MRMLLLLVATFGLSACFDNPTRDYAQHLIGSWRMASPVAGKPAEGVLHFTREGDYILDNRNSAPVAAVQAPGSGRWALLRDELELLALQASPLSDPAGRNAVPVTRLQIVALNQDRLITADPDHGVRIEWVRLSRLN